ncbi:hypothetical protein [Mucilaginibacter ginkgonis]|uniref:Uncharacterized protein n=1 Tax=Mucilaginibacter ginkgonis TaxID=2682091 RepID=A0A6I4HZ32_9SPHI|nr:hypothetical protein [Mucilaginibacter ginkgonis]QQL50277.1 hypothetical protein GO620_002140 [Mucilaginibacter ginkgonis]
METLKRNFIFLFSEAHLHDLAMSEAHYREQDLNHMEWYVKDNYITRDHVYKRLHFYLARPVEAYKGIDFDVFHRVLENPYEYIAPAFDFEGGEAVGNIIKALFDLPLFDFPRYETPNVPPEFAPFSTGFRDVKTINDALKSMSGLGTLLYDKKLYRKYQNWTAQLFDRDQYSWDIWSFDFDERMKDSLFGKTFREMVKDMTAGNDADDEYQCFINTYTQLEFLGVTQEKKGGKKKANTYWDIRRDATHAFFASKADYLVTDDRGMQEKAFIVYRMLKYRTEVLSTTDFIGRSALLTRNEDDTRSFLNGIRYTLQKGMVVRQEPLEQATLLKTLYPVFNYFNRLQSNEDGHLIFLRNSHPKYGLMYSEMELLVEKCKRIFGPPILVPHLPSDYKNIVYGDNLAVWKIGKEMVRLVFEEVAGQPGLFLVIGPAS